MNTRALLAALAGAVVNFLLGWLVYGILMMGYFESQSTTYPGLMMEEPNLILIFLANLVIALLFVYLFGRFSGPMDFGKGLIAGLIIGLLMGATINLYYAAMWNLMSTTGLIVDTLISAVLYGVMGGVVGVIMRSPPGES